VVDAHTPDAEWAARRFLPGEVVEVEREDLSWPDWLLCRQDDGARSWLPKADLELSGDIATLKNEYDSTELNSEADDLVTVERAYGGWAWCTTNDGRAGWLPEEKLTLI
jgi:hypothetical protein